MVRNLPANAGGARDTVSILTLTLTLTLEKEIYSPVFLPGELQGQRSLAGYSPWGRKESGNAKRLSTHSTYINANTD